MAKRDYYEILGIGKNASPDEIKKAYRRLAVQHHPDRGGDEAQFKEVGEAYEILKDPSKRQRYDQFGHAGVGSSAASDGNPFAGFGAGGENVNFDFGDLGLGDIFGSFFGGGMGGQGRRSTRGRDVETGVEISFEQAVFGTEVELELTLEDMCEQCKGTAAEPGTELKTCEQCKGSGQISHLTRTLFGNIQQTRVCPNCNGRGKIPEKPCSVCGGKGTKRQHQNIKLKVPAGIDDGAVIRLHGRGEAMVGGTKGDLYVNIRVKPHKKFTREGDLILSSERINMVDAALGTEVEVETVDGPIKMKVPAGTQSGTDFKLSGHGVTHFQGHGRGSHIVTIVVDTPKKLSAEQKELLEKLKTSGKKSFWR